MSAGLIARHLLGVWQREQNYLDPPKVTPMLVWKEVWEINGKYYEVPEDPLCAPLDECSPEEQEAARALPEWIPPDMGDREIDWHLLGAKLFGKPAP